MRRADVEAVAELAGEALAAGGGFVQEMHEAIAGRSFRAVGIGAQPVRLIHDGLARAMYGGVRGALRSAARAGGLMAAASAEADAPPLSALPVGSAVIGALNGVYGHVLAERRNGLALDMEIRRRGRAITPTRRELRTAFPDATPRVAVFLHGLCETDEAWWLPARGSDGVDRRSYGDRLRDELGFTPVYLRYNTGLHISENGRSLSRLLEDLLAAWPLAVDELVLVGHSMGGLVARSACHYGARGERSWTEAARHVFCLGTPHLGADLEKGANLLGWMLGRVPETRPLARVLNARSAGIKDLRFGACVEEDWCDCDPDEFLRDRCTEVPFLADANYYFIGAKLSEGPLGTLIGDLLVRIPSASGAGNGRGRRIPFEVDNGQELAGLTHFDLLNHLAVYGQLRTWISRRPARGLMLAAGAG